MATEEGNYLLQKLDCNCNDCKFMERDLIEQALWKGYTEYLQYREFIRNRYELLRSAGSCLDNNNKGGYSFFMDKIKKLKFQFDKAQITLGYGICLNRKGKWSQPVSFVGGTYQKETQHCFVHRKD